MAARSSALGMGPGAARQSMYPQSATSSASSMFSGQSMSSANQARLASKQAELEGLRALKEQSARMVKELEKLAEKVDIMADGGDAIASVMESWQGVFRAIQIARSSTVFMNGAETATSSADTSADQEDEDDLYNYGSAHPSSRPAFVDTMVRIPIDLDGTLTAQDAPDADASGN